MLSALKSQPARRLKLADHDVSPLPYAGSQRASAPQLHRLLGSTQLLIEPFAGSASVSLSGARAGLYGGVWLNDAYRPVSNFFHQIQLDCEALLCSVSKIIDDYDLYRLSSLKQEDLTQEWAPDWARDVARRAGEHLLTKLDEPSPEGAAATYVLHRCSYGSKGAAAGLSLQRMSGKLTPSIVGALRLHAQTFGRAQFKITNQCWSEVIASADRDATIYLDPPYWNGQLLYGRRGELHKKFVSHWFETGCFHEVVNRIGNRTVITLDANPEHLKGLHSWATYSRMADYQNGKPPIKEYVFLNFEAEMTAVYAKAFGWTLIAPSDGAPRLAA